MKYKSYKGASERLKLALDAIDYPAAREGRSGQFADDFGLSPTSAHRMLVRDHIPSRGDVLERIACALKISPAYWMYGLDPYCEELFLGRQHRAWEAIFKQLKASGRSLDKLPAGLLLRLAEVVYRHIVQNDGQLDAAYVANIIDLATGVSSDNEP